MCSNRRLRVCVFIIYVETWNLKLPYIFQCFAVENLQKYNHHYITGN